jgi:FemAB-related protein (PEP-CTERM system-associated)
LVLVPASAARKIHISLSSDRVEWDAFVEATPGATFGHRFGWHDVVRSTMGQTPMYLAARGEDGSVLGVLPMVRLSSPLFGERFVSMPYLNDGGPIGDAAAVAALRDHAVALAGPGGRLELRTRVALPDTTPDVSKVSVFLDLPADPEILWTAFPSKLRAQVRRPQKAGLTTRFGVDGLSDFYAVWSRNMRDLGTPVLPRTFFASIARTFPGHLLVGTVYRGEEPVAGGAGFLYGDEFEITWASALREYSKEAPNMLLYWEFMRETILRGGRVFNFGRSTPGESTHRFKLQWGGRTEPLPWVVYGGESAGDGSPGRLARTASNLWRKLPLPVANAVGPVLARQLPWW